MLSVTTLSPTRTDFITLHNPRFAVQRNLDKNALKGPCPGIGHSSQNSFFPRPWSISRAVLQLLLFRTLGFYFPFSKQNVLPSGSKYMMIHWLYSLHSNVRESCHTFCSALYKLQSTCISATTSFSFEWKEKMLIISNKLSSKK